MTEQRQRWEGWKSVPERFEDLLGFIAEGQGGLHGYARREGIAVMTLRDWVEAEPDRAVKYARARELGADALAEEVVEVSRERAADPQCRRVRMDAAKWAAGKIRPKLYGDHIQQDVTATVTLEDHLLRLAQTG